MLTLERVTLFPPNTEYMMGRVDETQEERYLHYRD